MEAWQLREERRGEHEQGKPPSLGGGCLREPPRSHPLTAPEGEQQLFQASCPSLRQVLAEFSLPPSPRAPPPPPPAAWC